MLGHGDRKPKTCGLDLLMAKQGRSDSAMEMEDGWIEMGVRDWMGGIIIMEGCDDGGRTKAKTSISTPLILHSTPLIHATLLFHHPKNALLEHSALTRHQPHKYHALRQLQTLKAL
jgi:hypothetical protein